MYSVCILIYGSMYLYSYPSTHDISGLAAGGAWEQFEVRLKITIQWTQRYTLRPWSSVFGDALGEAIIERVWRYTWRPWLSELARRNWASLEIHLEAVIERVWRYALGGHDRATLQAVIERVWRYTWRLWLSEVGDMHLKAMIVRTCRP